MELTPKQQTTEFLRKSAKVLILTPRADGDGLGGAVALMLALKKLGKEVTIVCQEKIPYQFSFLPKSSEFKKEITGVKDFVITLDCSQAPVEKLGYKIEDNKLNIIITPQRGNFAKENVTFSAGSYK
jgi:phosphoesterase RecJ-like protein